MSDNDPIKKRELEAVERTLRLFAKLRKRKDFTKARTTFRNFVAKYPLSQKIHVEYAEIAILCGEWGEALRSLKILMSLQGASAERDGIVLRVAEIYRDLGQIQEAERRIRAGLRVRPGSLVLKRARAELSVLFGISETGDEAWRSLLTCDEFQIVDGVEKAKTIASCVAGFRLFGCANEADELLRVYFDGKDPAWSEILTDGYFMMPVFCNGRTRLEYRTKIFDFVERVPVSAKQIVMTFDTMLQGWDSVPYGYRPLSTRAADMISVRKFSAEDFHQDFSRDAFLAVVLPIVRNYESVVAIGQSLGAYSSLYYAGTLPGCRILASAPRNPQNPKYSGPKYARYDLFRHSYDMPIHHQATPTIVYDPKNSEDGAYVERSLRRCFPKARFVKYPYCGHSIPRFLLEVGLLKTTTLAFCDGSPFPEFDRRVRGKSAEYLRNLAKLNYAAGRTRTALRLAERALKLGTYPERSKALIEKFNESEKSLVSNGLAVKNPKKKLQRSFFQRLLKLVRLRFRQWAA